MDSIVVQRKKPGRPPKVTKMIDPNESDNIVGGIGNVGLVQNELGGTAALVAISPIPEDQNNAAAAADASSAECRRSSRKKIIKFDVRDLLNKHRKPHKIQIEARFDSNAPSTKNLISTSIVNTNVSPGSNKEKCFIEKTSIIQRNTVSDKQQIPIPITTEIFKPNQSLSLIVTQMESNSSSSYQKQQQKLMAFTPEASTSDVIAPKRRGRPPKNRSLPDRLMEEQKKQDVIAADLSNDSKSEKDKTFIESYENLTAIDSDKSTEVICSTPEAIHTPMNTKVFIYDEDDLIDEPLTSKDDIDAQRTKNSVSIVIEAQAPSTETKQNETDAALQHTSSYKIQEARVSIERLPISLTKESILKRFEKDFTVDDEPSSSEKGVTEVKCETTVCEEQVTQDCAAKSDVHKDIKDVDCLKATSIDLNITATSIKQSVPITLPPKKHLSKLKEFQIAIEEDEFKSDLASVGSHETIKSETTNIDTPENTILNFDIEKNAGSPCSSESQKASTPTPRRFERRSGRRLDDNSNSKTLEETFAEIAANSSRAILDEASQKFDEGEIEQTEKVETEEYVENKNSKEKSDLSKDVVKVEETSESSEEAPTTDSNTIIPKRRGRKPKTATIESTSQKDDVQVPVLDLEISRPESVEIAMECESEQTQQTLLIEKNNKEFIEVIDSMHLNEDIISNVEDETLPNVELEEKKIDTLNIDTEKPILAPLEEFELSADNIDTTKSAICSTETEVELSKITVPTIEPNEISKPSENTESKKKHSTEIGTEISEPKVASSHKHHKHETHCSSSSQKKDRHSTKSTSKHSSPSSEKKKVRKEKKSTDESKSERDGNRKLTDATTNASSTPKESKKFKEHGDESIKKVREDVCIKKSAEKLKEKTDQQFKISKKLKHDISLKKSNSKSKEVKFSDGSTSKSKESKKLVLVKEFDSNDDILKKSTKKSVHSKEHDVNTSGFKERTEDDKERHEKKKHKHKSIETGSSTSKSKGTLHDGEILTTPKQTPKDKDYSISSSKLVKTSSSHKKKRKHLDNLEFKSKESSNSQEGAKKKEIKSSPSNSSIKDEYSLSQIKKAKDKAKDAAKAARKERQRKLKDDFAAALAEDRERTKQLQSVEFENQQPMTPESHPDESTTDIVLPPTPDECSPKEKAQDENNLEIDIKKDTDSKDSMPPSVSDALFDIEKFIEAGVNLLKRDYKIEGNEEKLANIEPKVETETETAAPAEIVENTANVVGATEILEELPVTADNEMEDVEEKPHSPTLDFYETPADTPVSTPGPSSPSDSPIPAANNVDTYYYSDGVRRSHRLKKITNAPKALVGRGLVRDRDRERLALRDDIETKSHYSMEDHLMDLAEVEAKNAKFLKEMEERLSNFEVIKENEYHCERVVSREARKMVCDCFLTAEESERGELGCGEDCLNRLLMIECSTGCKVGERCTNKRFQKFLCAPCRVFRTEKKGFGIMADIEIHPGEFIMEYVGEVLDSEEFEDKRNAYSKDKNRHYYFMALRSDAIIDATIKGNISRFINHSCDPNAETQKWTVNGELRIGFFSRKTIMPGEEITFDYQYQRYGREAQRCYCESANCRGWIGEEPNSDEGEQLGDDDDEDDDEEDDEDEEEDENDVVSMVKGLMSVDDAEDEDEKDETRAAVKKLRKGDIMQESEPEGGAKEDVDSDESKQKFMAYLSKISAKIEIHKQNKREEKKRKRRQRQRKQATIEKRQPAAVNARFLEDPDLEDEIDFLSRCGLKNQSDTLRFSRLMVRAKLVPTRLNLLSILRAGELPCRRLFLDYHGLHLLHGWMNEDGRTDMTIRLALLQTLECLPMANKTILTDSKVYQAIRGWSNTEKSQTATGNGDGSSSSPSDDSSKESTAVNTGEKTDLGTAETTVPAPSDSDNAAKMELEKLALKLLNSWDSLPEIFRIPKRERIEQMKEHEREADRQYAATVEATEDDDQKTVSTDRYQKDRFERRFGRPQGARTITVVGAAGSAMGVMSKRPPGADVLSPEDTKHLSKEQRRKLFAAKVARDEAEKKSAERRREFETKCSFFGLDPRITRPEDLPFCVSDGGQWFNERRQPIATPVAFAHVQTPTKPMSTNPSDYYLPAAASSLPTDWTFAINDQGKIYYYHLKHRVPQWEPPTTEQISLTKWSDSESETEEEDDDEPVEEMSEERIKEIEAIQTQEELTAFLKKITLEQRQLRYKRLVDERPISPRREEDRIYNQIEMRKYKENKEKIKKRKEEIRRKRNEALKNLTMNLSSLTNLDDAVLRSAASAAAAATAAAESLKLNAAESSDLPTDALPIQDYLLSSDDDDDDINEMKAECNNSPLLDKIVQGDKIVDELDALTTKRQLKRPLPPHRDIGFDLNSSLSSLSGNEIASTSIEKNEHKKRKQEKKEKSKRSKESSDAKYRKLKEKFRCEIAGIIVHHLKPYRKDSCTFGRIKSNEDFNHLAKKLTHFVMIKELKYCESVGQTLVVTESVKNKSREFIKKYMAKYETGYVKPNNDPEFKDIPFTL